MCGILGAADLTAGVPRRYDPAEFGLLTDLLAHRGPDGAGIETRPGFIFGHRRLRILDLTDQGRQPMWDVDGTVCLTFNGFISNFSELRGELKRRGRVFRSGTDTEVILYAYREWGAGCIERLEGMFAFGLFDMQERLLLLARDRLGIKPLFYTRIDDQLVFCSELKGILGFPGFRRQLNYRAVSAFLSYRHPVEDETYFAGVHSLPPGCRLVVKGGQANVSTYWELRPHGDSNRPNGGSERVAELITLAVKAHVTSDVPIVTFLSGGLDSSILLYEATRATGGPVPAITARFEEREFDESPHAQEVAQDLGSPLRVIDIEAADYLDQAAHLMAVKDQPLGMHNEVAVMLLARRAKETATVALCGEGADELFSGYGRLFRSPFDYSRVRMGRLLGPVGRSLLRRIGLGVERQDRSWLAFFLSRYTYFPFEEKHHLMRREVVERVEHDRRLIAVFAEHIQRGGGSKHDGISHVMLSLHLPGLLQMLDAATMAYGVEARVPFLDHRLVECAMALPEREKLRWRSTLDRLAAVFRPVEFISERHDITKEVLRRLYACRLPKSVLTRKKQPFPVPLAQWLCGPLGHAASSKLFGPDARVGNIFCRERLKAWYERKAARPDNFFGRQVWQLINLEHWLRTFF